MPTLFLDWETDFDEKAGLTLKKMALRAYLREAPMVGFSFAIDDGPFTWVDAKNPDFLALCAEISDFGQEPGNIIAAYNAPFDCRVGRFGRLTRGGEPLGMEWPETIHDAMEFAMAAWPNMPGGYSLRNVAAWLNLPPKLSIQDVLAGKVTWEDYCNRDGELLRQIYWRAIRRLSPEEIYYAENCNRVRGLAYTINDATVASSLAAFTANTEAGVAAAVEFLSCYARDGEDLGDTIFGGYADGKVRSVKAKALKDLLVSALGFATTSTSLKKINPSHLAQRPDVAELLRSTTKANKGLYYQKRTTALVGASEMDMEKGYFRATNTGRTSAPSCGKGVNTANLTKKDKTIAKPLRQMLALPDHLCYVRIDAANVEYRVNGILTDCAHICNLFKKDIDADPYSAFVLEGFGVHCKKGEPMRDVVGKAAVLGYGFGMGTMRAIEEFNKSVADPINNVSVREIEKLCFERNWSMPTSRYLKGAITRVGCHWSIAVAANEAREAFHALHPEIFATADWLVRSVEMLAGSKDPERLIDVLYSFSGAPDRNKLNLSIDRQLEFPTVRVTLFGHSIPTVTWRHLSVSHPGVDGLGAVTANKGPRRFHRALAIENVVQSSARIGLMRCENEFTRRTGWLTDSVYDEILAIVPRDRDCVLTARREMVDIMSPHGPHGMGWAFYGKPEEVTVTRTRYEDEKESKIAFAKLEANDPTWKEHLH
jgi:hypothetical protein